jgi:23S rRNA (pseudouridine1915-N3)-methyltransferase
MRIHLIAVGNRMPAWVETGFQEYAKRLSHVCPLNLIEIRPATRTGDTQADRAIAEEGKRITAVIPPGAWVVALDEHGLSWTSPQLAERLREWQETTRDLALLVGGADGLSPECLARARQRWSLSPLTLPHALVRILVAEQLYRAWSILQQHPYHRA